jgi:hypothetical protein
LTRPAVDGRIARMFRAKRRKQAAQAEAEPQAQGQVQAPQQPVMSNGYQVTELPTFHGRTRKVVVYTTDAQGRVVKKIKK